MLPQLYFRLQKIIKCFCVKNFAVSGKKSTFAEEKLCSTIKNVLFMKKIFTLIASAVMAISANAAEPTPAVTYTFDDQASTYVLGENAEATTYSMDGKEGFSVNYVGASSAKMQVKLAANQNIFFEYGNSSAKNNAMKTGANYVQFDSKNFIIHIPVVTGDVIRVKYSAKGGNAANIQIDGSTPPIEANADAVTSCSGKTEAEAVIFSATATKGGTAKIKETNGGMRVYAISINQEPTAVQGVAEAKVAKTAPAKVLKNGQIFIGNYTVAGAQVK